MVVCHCEALNDASIRQVFGDRPMTVDDVGSHCGAGVQCGGCRDTIASLLEHHQRGLAESRVSVGG